MKPAILLSIFMLLTNNLFSQFEWVVNIGESTFPEGLYKTSSGHTFLTYNGTDAGAVIVDDVGFGTLFNLPSSIGQPPPWTGLAGGNTRVLGFFEMPDSSLMFILESYYCEFGSGNVSIANYLKKYDKYWTEVELPNAVINLEFLNFITGAPLVDGRFVLATPYKLKIHAIDGSLISVIDLSDINDLVITAEDILIIATTQGLVKMDVEGQIDTVFSGYIFDQIKLTDQGNLIGKKADSLFLLSPNFEVLSVFAFDDQIIKDFDEGEGRIVILTSIDQVFLFDSLLNYQNEFPLLDPTDFEFITIASDGIILAAKETYGGDHYWTTSRAPFLKKYPFDGNALQVSREDVGVINIDLGYGPFISESENYYTIEYFDVKISVQNFGNDFVNSLTLNTSLPELIFHSCSLGYQLKTDNYSNLSLNAGDSIELNWGNLTFYSKNYPSSSLDICFWTSLPDGRIESNSSNDIYCADFVVSNEEQFEDPAFQIFPNPSSALSTLKYHLPVGTNAEIRIFNNLGNPVQQYRIENEEGEFTLKGYPCGLYYAVLIIENKVVRTVKFVQL